MIKLLAIAMLGGVLALSLVAGITPRAAAQTASPTPTPAPPVQGAKLAVGMYVDTVQGTQGDPKPVVGCSQSNLFKQGQQVVFRMWGINVKAGGTALTPKNVKSAVVNVPGIAPIPMFWGNHGSVAFWAAAWKVDKAYPLGIVNFSIVVKTKADKKHHLKSLAGTFTQAGLAPPSQLTITP
jgi:hypothetical protein